jgi:hypothetical protein
MPEEPPHTGEPSVLGNLPHSRPGRRSEKRDAGRPAAAAGAAARKAETTGAAAARASGARRRARAAEPKPAGAVREEPPAARGPVGAAVHLATKVAGTGVRVTWAVAREVLRRLPRP